MRRMIKKIRWVSALLIVLICRPAGAQNDELAGRFFGDPVPKGNYYFALRAVLIFSTPWGGVPADREQLETRLWQDLLMSYEASRRGIIATDEDLGKEIDAVLKGADVPFSWREDRAAYARWVSETLQESLDLFENQLRYLVQMKKLHQQVLDGITPIVGEEEAFQEFLNEHNTLSVEIAEFDDLKSAREFYDRLLARPQAWEELKAKGLHKFSRPGFVALEFLMHMWKLPQKALYAMIEMKVGDVHPPEPIYRGYGVFKVLDIRRAKESDFPERRGSYDEQLRLQKKHQGFQAWLEDLQARARVQKYISPPDELFQP